MTIHKLVAKVAFTTEEALRKDAVSYGVDREADIETLLIRLTFTPGRSPSECGYEVKGTEIEFQGGSNYEIVTTLDVNDSTEFLREAVRSYESDWPGFWSPETFGAAAEQVLMGHHDTRVTEPDGLEIKSRQIIHDYRFLPEHYDGLNEIRSFGI
jgi:hypothetical protein